MTKPIGVHKTSKGAMAEDFNIELAGVPARIRCEHAETKAFLKDYLSDREPLFTVEPTAADLDRMQTELDRMAEADGFPTHAYADSFLENNAVHALLAEKLVEYDVLLVHGSALCMDGRAYVFIARSGTGKSTHARLWREAFGERVWMINDDKPLLKIEDEGVTVWGTPWDGKHHLSRNASAPLAAIVCLERDAENHIEPMSKADAFPFLMKQAYASKDPATMARIVNLEKQLLNAVDFYILGCTEEPQAAQVAWEGMNAK